MGDSIDMNEIETARAVIVHIAHAYAEDADQLLALAERLWEWVVEEQGEQITFTPEPGR
jgi:hypothetical protein